ncbi:MAG TPA: c-type cytochrome [Thermoleophilaceae bacterium]|nr:c-type cytochrome [Thermoleophilaceae bacterium]
MGTILFILFWVLLGLAVFFVATRGGLRGARSSLYGDTRGFRRTAAVVFTVAYILLGVAIPTLIISGDRRSTAVAGTGIELTPAQNRGRELFGEECNQCHTLSAADTVGRVGPNLDQLRPPATLVLNAIVNGRQRGNGTMPAGLLQGQDASDVASFVAATAGK